MPNKPRFTKRRKKALELRTEVEKTSLTAVLGVTDTTAEILSGARKGQDILVKDILDSMVPGAPGVAIIDISGLNLQIP